MKKLSIKDKECLVTMMMHSRMDLNYGLGGSFAKDDKDVDMKAIKQVEKAIRIVNEIVQDENK